MSEDAKKFSLPVIILIVVFADIFLGFVLFFFSGWNFLWWEAWVLLILLTFLMAYMVIWLNKHNPQVLRNRASVKGMSKKDIIPMSLLIIATFALLIVTCLDGGRYHWLTVPLWGKIIGFIGFTIGFIITVIVQKENAYASKVVKIDKAGGQKVISTGPYAIVRHPMYSGFLLLFFSWSIALGSLYGLIPWVFLTIVLIYRISLEEKLLKEELEGYTEYTKKVKKRLIPRVW